MKWSRAVLVAVAVVGCTDLPDAPDAMDGLLARTTQEGGAVAVEVGGDPWSADNSLALDTMFIVESQSPEDGTDSLDAPPLFGVRGAVHLSDGRVVLANAGTHELVWYTSSGKFLKKRGREGQGPGEFGGIQKLMSCADDQLVVSQYDRVSFFSKEGEFLRSEAVTPRGGDGSLWVHGVSSDCRRILFGATPHNPPPSTGEVQAVNTTLFWQDTDGVRDTVAERVPWVEKFGGTLTGEPVALARPWGRYSVWATDGEDVLVGRGDPEFRLANDQGENVGVVRWEPVDRPVSDADRQAYAQARGAFLRDKPAFQEEIYPTFDRIPLPEHLPHYASVMLGEGEVMVRRYPKHAAGHIEVSGWGDEGQEEWVVIPLGEGRVGTVSLPEGKTLLDLDGRTLFVVSRDQLDRESLLVLRRAESS